MPSESTATAQPGPIQNNTDRRPFADRMRDPKTPQDRYTASCYRKSVEAAGKSWDAELRKLKGVK